MVIKMKKEVKMNEKLTIFKKLCPHRDFNLENQITGTMKQIQIKKLNLMQTIPDDHFMYNICYNEQLVSLVLPDIDFDSYSLDIGPFIVIHFNSPVCQDNGGGLIEIQFHLSNIIPFVYHDNYTD